jgi:hypothetical protein
MGYIFCFSQKLFDNADKNSVVMMLCFGRNRAAWIVVKVCGHSEKERVGGQEWKERLQPSDISSEDELKEHSY